MAPRPKGLTVGVRRIAVPADGEPVDEITEALRTRSDEPHEDLKIKLESGAPSTSLDSLMLSARWAGLERFILEAGGANITVLPDTERNRQQLPTEFAAFLISEHEFLANTYAGRVLADERSGSWETPADLSRQIDQLVCSASPAKCETIEVLLAKAVFSPELLALLTQQGRRKLFLAESSTRIDRRAAAQTNVVFEGLTVGNTGPLDLPRYGFVRIPFELGSLSYSLRHARGYFDTCYTGSATSKVLGEGTISVVAPRSPEGFLLPTQDLTTTLTDRELVECASAVVRQISVLPATGLLRFTIRFQPAPHDAPPP